MCIKKYVAGASFAFVMVIGFLTSGKAVAVTPDGITPANEGICSDLQGATPGLYGLCVAYCEAQDLDTMGKEPPNTKILENYNKKKRLGDPDMPCVSPNYGCFTQADLDAIDPMLASCKPMMVDGARISDDYIEYGSPTSFARIKIRPTLNCGFFRLSPLAVYDETITEAQAAAGFEAINLKCEAIGQ